MLVYIIIKLIVVTTTIIYLFKELFIDFLYVYIIAWALLNTYVYYTYI